jgi:hypothetical protein
VNLPADLYDEYTKALKAGRRDGAPLPVYAGVHAGELRLGLHEVPLSKIRGTFTAGRQSAFSESYMPLLGEDTEFAAKWRQVLRAHLTEGLREPILLYEYLGYYYTLEGNKRVSVLRHCGAYSYTAEVTRLLPKADASGEELEVYRELIGPDKRGLIEHMWFSRAGTYTRLLAHGGEREIKDAFNVFRRLYHSLGFGALPLTTGDAFAEYVGVFGLPAEQNEDILRAKIRNCGAYFAHEFAERPAPVPLTRSPRLNIAFVFAGASETNRESAMHDAGRLALAAEYPQHVVKTFTARQDAEDAYETLCAAAEFCGKGGVVFSVSPLASAAALRISIENKQLRVMQRNAAKTRGALMSYGGDTGELACLCGLLASYLSQTGRIGYIRPHPRDGAQEADFAHFAQGAAAIRAAADAEEAVPEAYTPQAILAACRAFASSGRDIALVPRLFGSPLEPGGFAGAFARLARLDGEGIIRETYAMPAWHWGVLYSALLNNTDNTGILQLGVESGLLRAHLCSPAATPGLARLRDGFGAIARQLCDGS